MREIGLKSSEMVDQVVSAIVANQQVNPSLQKVILFYTGVWNNKYFSEIRDARIKLIYHLPEVL